MTGRFLEQLKRELTIVEDENRKTEDEIAGVMRAVNEGG